MIFDYMRPVPGWLVDARREEREELGRSGRSSGGDRIGARGRRRRPRVQNKVRNVASGVPIDLQGDWRSLARFFEKSPNLTYFLYEMYKFIYLLRNATISL